MQPWIHWKWNIMHRYIYYLFIIKNKANKAPARGFWQRQGSAFFDVRLCHPNADSMYAEGVMEIEQGKFTPLVFTTTGGKADECVKYHSRLVELIANKNGESYSSAISWIRAKVSFAIVRSAILCLRGSRSRRRQLDFVDSDLQIDNIRACPN